MILVQHTVHIGCFTDYVLYKCQHMKLKLTKTIAKLVQ